MRSLSLLAVLSLLLTGCLGGQSPDAADPGDAGGVLPGEGPSGAERIEVQGVGGHDALAPVAFTEPVTINKDGYGYEPGIEVGPDGTIYVTAHKASVTNEGTRLSSWLWYSQDNGTTWADMPSPLQAHQALPALEGDFALDGQGRFYFVDLAAADNTLSRWGPGPVWHWSRPVQGTLHLDDRPWLAAHGDGIVYYIGNAVVDAPAPNNLPDGEGSRYWLTVSEDAGLTWEPRYGFPNSWWCTIDAARTDDRTVYVACTEPGLANGVTGGEDRVVAYRSTDRGRTWERTELASLGRFSGSGYPSTALDRAGDPYVAWTDLPSGAHATTNLSLAQRTAQGPWQVVELTPFEGTFERVWVAAGDPGTVAVAFYATNDTQPGASSAWYPYVLLTDEGGDPGATWHLARLSEEPVAVGDRSPGDFFQCAIGPDNAVHVSFGHRIDRAGPDPSSLTVRGLAEDIRYVRQTVGPNLLPDG